MYTWLTGDDPGFIGLYDCANIPSADNNYAGQNNPGWCNTEADKALQMAELDSVVSLSREQRKPYYETFFKFWTDEVPVLPLFSNTRVYAARAGLEGYLPPPTSAPDTWNIWEWTLSK
jgi:peptide/nickel transport system substrate-binding protein